MMERQKAKQRTVATVADTVLYYKYYNIIYKYNII